MSNTFISDELYRKIVQFMPIPTVDILFLNDKNEILLGKRNNEPLMGIYYVPGWRINKWEKSKDAAKRKAKDELGIDIDISRLQFVWVYDDIFHNSAFDDISTHCIPVTYLYRLNHREEWNLILWDTQHFDIHFFSLMDSRLHEMVQMRIQDLKQFENIKNTN